MKNVARPAEQQAEAVWTSRHQSSLALLAIWQSRVRASFEAKVHDLAEAACIRTKLRLRSSRSKLPTCAVMGCDIEMSDLRCANVSTRSIPKAFRWLSERYPLISQLIEEDRIPEFGGQVPCTICAQSC